MRRVLAVALGLVVVRSAVWMLFEQAHFDSDQAIVGLMGKHVVEGRAFPLFFYGQPYLLAVEGWLAAPIFGIAGASVFTLKLPLLLVNVAVAAILLRLLTHEVKLSPGEALVVSLFFLLPPPIAASRLIEAAGANLEPFLYVLLLWLARERPIVFGLVAAIGFLHREFTAYGVTAIVLLDVLDGRLRRPERWRFFGLAVVAAVIVLAAAGWLAPYAPVDGPGTTPAPLVAGEETGSAPPFWTSKLCWRPSELASNFGYLLRDNLGVIFGWTEVPLRAYVSSGLTQGAWFVWIPLTLTGVAATAGALLRRSTPSPSAASRFPAYLILVGVQAAVVYAGLGCVVKDAMLVRYTLLVLFLPIGVLAWGLARQPAAWIRDLVLCGVLLWAGVSAVETCRVYNEYRHPPPSPYRELTDYLLAHGVRYAWAPYWTAYQLNFLSGERLTVASDIVRIEEYQRQVTAHDAEAVVITEGGACDRGVRVAKWCVVKP